MKSFRKNPVDPKSSTYTNSPKENPHPPIIFSGCTLPESTHFKLVGLTMTPNLTWTKHIDRIYRNSNRASALLDRATLVLDDKALNTIYKSHIRSRLEYCSPIWMGSSKVALAKLEKVQSRAIRMMGQKQTYSLQSLHHRRTVAGLCLMHRLQHKTAPSALLHLCPLPYKLPQRQSRRKTSNHLTFERPNVRKSKYWVNSFIPLFTKIWNDHVNASVSKIQKFKNSKNKSTK